jgi:hypothetical protein
MPVIANPKVLYVMGAAQAVLIVALPLIANTTSWTVAGVLAIVGAALTALATYANHRQVKKALVVQRQLPPVTEPAPRPVR